MATIGVVLLGLFSAVAVTPARAAYHDPNSEFYVALGGSASVGWQPTAAKPGGQPTDTGYANDLAETERSNWVDLRLVQLGCPGETTTTMLDGGSHCPYRSGSQLAAATAFLRRHPSTVLLTVDLGFNDVVRCMKHQQVDQACVAQALEVVREQLPQILSSLRAAGGSSLQIVGVGHYDPYLADYRQGGAARAFSSESLTVITQLDDVMRSAYSAAGVPMADVASAFQTASTEPTELDGTGVVPRNVAEACALTWMCAAAPFGPNPHPNDPGYRAISDAISSLVRDR